MMTKNIIKPKHKTSDLLREVVVLAKLKKFTVNTMGYLDGYPLLCFQREGTIKSRNSKLVAALFHGDEIASTLGVVKFLKTVKKSELDSINLSLLPMVNPTGHAAGTRENKWGEDPNRGYAKVKNVPKEGKILLSHKREIFKSSANGFLSLHEDSDIKDGVFTYCYSDHPRGIKMAHKLMNEASKHVGLAKNKMLLNLKKDGDGMIKPENPGVVFDDVMDSFDDWLKDNKVKPVIVTETPCKDNDLGKRVEANYKMLRVFCGLKA